MNCKIDTDAHFREFVSGVAAQLSAMGLVKLSVSGEINASTVTKPTPSHGTYPYDGFQSKGAQVWRFNDALQTEFPVYLLIEYGGQEVVSPWWYHYGPGIRVTCGTTYSGLAITANATAAQRVYLDGNDNGTSVSCWFSGGTSRFAMALSQNGLFFSVERFKDGNGNDTGRGVALLGASWYAMDGSTFYGADGLWQMAMLPGGNNPPTETKWGAAIPTVEDGTVNTSVVGFTIHPYTPRMEQALLNAVMYFSGDLAGLTSYSIDIAGQMHTYFTLDSFSYLTPHRSGELLVAMRYE